MTKVANHKQHDSEKGTKISYVIGFILSLIFTALAYSIVVNKTMQGTALLGAILALAVLQMFVQIFFFLHLGRGPKPLYNVFFFVSTAFLILVVVVGSVFIMDNLHYTMAPKETAKKIAQDEAITQVEGEKTGACRRTGVNHNVTIKNGVVTPRHTQAKICDTITFINQDSEKIEIAFGSHPEHLSYGGVEELQVYKGYNKTLTLNELGQHFFHNHNNPVTAGTFEVEL